MSGWSILTLPKPEQLSALVGMRTRLEGTQTSGAGESHAQEANVAEVSYGETVIVEPEYPDKSSATRRLSRAHWGDVPLTRRHQPDKQVTNGVVGSQSEGDHLSDPSAEHSPTPRWGKGCRKDPVSWRLGFSGLGAGLQGNGRAPTAHGESAVRATPEPPRLPVQGRRRGRQGQKRGSGPVVRDGVTPVQGVWESPAQGQGVERFRAQTEPEGEHSALRTKGMKYVRKGAKQPELDRRMW
jgi:hypothetical protein